MWAIPTFNLFNCHISRLQTRVPETQQHSATAAGSQEIRAADCRGAERSPQRLHRLPDSAPSAGATTVRVQRQDSVRLAQLSPRQAGPTYSATVPSQN